MAKRIFTVVDEQPVYLPEELSWKILLMLDGRSLHEAKQVCQGWNEAVLPVETKLTNHWKFAPPRIIEKTLKIDGYEGWLLSLTENRAVMMVTRDRQEDNVKIVEFTTMKGEVVSSIDVANCAMLRNSNVKYPDFAKKVGNSVIVVTEDGDDYPKVLVVYLQTHQITLQEYFGEEEDDGHGIGDLSPGFNETTREIHIGRAKLKIMEDHVKKEIVENNLPNIVAIKSNLCITRSPDGTRLWRCDGINNQEISLLDPDYWSRDQFEIYPDTSRIVGVEERFNSLSVWNSDTGNLIQHKPLSRPNFGPGWTELVMFKIEGNHLVMLVNERTNERSSHRHVLIYELDQVFAGENPTPRKISLGNVVMFHKLLVDKTSITVASDCGSVVKLDFWGCE